MRQDDWEEISQALISSWTWQNWIFWGLNLRVWRKFFGLQCLTTNIPYSYEPFITVLGALNETLCEKTRAKPLAFFTAECDEKGDFTAVQCVNDTTEDPFCWCCLKNGAYVGGTLFQTLDVKIPDCSSHAGVYTEYKAQINRM